MLSNFELLPIIPLTKVALLSPPTCQLLQVLVRFPLGLPLNGIHRASTELASRLDI